MDAREIALLTLHDCAKQGGWSDGALKRRLGASQLDSREAALATRLCFCVLQNETLLDYYLTCFSNTPLKRMEMRVVILLRLGLCQMLFFTRIPHSAAVNSAVELTHRYCKNARAAGLVNGILRAIERRLDDLPTIPTADRLEHLSIRYSHPRWLLERWRAILGDEELVQLLEANNSIPPITVQVNTLRTDSGALQLRLTEAGVEALPHPWINDCLILNGTGNIESLESYVQGEFYVQDSASRLAVMAAAPMSGMHVLDCCAAPGGKSFAASIAMGDEGEILSCDLHPHKKKLILAGRDRLGLTAVSPMTADAAEYRPAWEAAFDLVLADVPCSGLGVIRKKPDVRTKDPDAIAQLPGIQQGILRNVSRYVRPGGVLLYSTCTLLPEENEQVVDLFLKEHAEYALDGFKLPQPIGDVPEGRITLWPHRHGTDGFFIARMRRKA